MTMKISPMAIAPLKKAEACLRVATRYAEMAGTKSPNRPSQLATAKAKAAEAVRILETI